MLKDGLRFMSCCLEDPPGPQALKARFLEWVVQGGAGLTDGEAPDVDDELAPAEQEKSMQ